MGRFIIYLLLNFFSPLLNLVFRYFRIFDFVVLVYPGTKRDVAAYIPFEILRKFFPTISIVGFIKKGKKGKRGIILTTKYYFEELTDKKVKKISFLIEKFALSIKAKKIALVGRLPKLLFKKENSLLVEGKTGTVFTILTTIQTTMRKMDLLPSKTNIGVIGIGFIGKEVLANLKSMGFASVIGVDPRFKENRILEDNIKKGRDFSLLNECDLVIILTPRGDDIKEIIPYLKKDIIVFDDTHPYIYKINIERIEKEKNGKVYKIVVSLEGMAIIPRFPGFESGWLPGCIVETIVASYNKIWSDQNQFNKIAHNIGFQALLVKATGKNDI